VGSGSTAPRRTTRLCRNPPAPASEKSGTPGKSSPRSRRAAWCCQRQVGNAHAQLTATGHGTVISRIMAPRQQDQIGRSRGKNAPDRKPSARQSDLSGKGMFGQRNGWNSRMLHSSAPSFLCHSSSDRTSRCGTGYRERHSATGLRVVVKRVISIQGG
jgi:hypothetical protein